jgi:hypothetical protein
MKPKCPRCPRRFDDVVAAREHVETTHREDR